MAETVQTQQDFSWRIYDGTAVTPNYIVMTFYELPELPAMPPIPPTEVILGGGVAAIGNVAAIIRDEAPIFAPLEFTVSFRMRADELWKLDALGNPRRLATWNVGSTPVVWQPVTDIGTRRSSRGVDIPCPLPAHVDQSDHLFNIETMDTAAPGSSGDDFIHVLKGCCVTNLTIPRAPGDVHFNLTIQCYGEIDTQAAAFTTGTETT